MSRTSTTPIRLRQPSVQIRLRLPKGVWDLVRPLLEVGTQATFQVASPTARYRVWITLSPDAEITDVRGQTYRTITAKVGDLNVGYPQLVVVTGSQDELGEIEVL